MTASYTRTNPHYLDNIVKRCRQLEGKAVLVGLPAGSGQDVITRGATHQFGSRDGNIPERPWLSEGIASGNETYAQISRSKVADVIAGDLSVINFYRFLGEASKSAIQEYLLTATFEPLKPATIKRKGSTRPLIDTGQMRQSVTYEIR